MVMFCVFQMAEASIAFVCVGVEGVVQHGSLENKPVVASVASHFSFPDRRQVEFIKILPSHLLNLNSNHILPG